MAGIFALMPLGASASAAHFIQGQIARNRTKPGTQRAARKCPRIAPQPDKRFLRGIVRRTVIAGNHARQPHHDVLVLRHNCLKGSIIALGEALNQYQVVGLHAAKESHRGAQRKHSRVECSGTTSKIPR